MLANFLKKSTPAHFIYLILLLLLYFLFTVSPEFESEFKFALVFEKLAYFLVLIFLLSVEVFVIKKNDLTKDSAYGLYFAVLLLGSFNATLTHSNYLFATIFLLLASRKIYSLRSHKSTIAKVFDASLWIGVGFLYFNWTALFLLVLYGALFNFRLFNWRTLLTPVLGFGTVILIFFSYHLWFDSLIVFYKAFSFDYAISLPSLYQLRFSIPLVFYMVLVFISMVVLVPRIGTIGSMFARSWKTLVLQLLIGIIIVVITPFKNGASILFVLMPLPIICTNYLMVLKSKYIKNLILYVALLISLVPYLL